MRKKELQAELDVMHARADKLVERIDVLIVERDEARHHAEKLYASGVAIEEQCNELRKQIRALKRKPATKKVAKKAR